MGRNSTLSLTTRKIYFILCQYISRHQCFTSIKRRHLISFEFTTQKNVFLLQIFNDFKEIFFILFHNSLSKRKIFLFVLVLRTLNDFPTKSSNNNLPRIASVTPTRTPAPGHDAARRNTSGDTQGRVSSHPLCYVVKKSSTFRWPAGRDDTPSPGNDTTRRNNSEDTQGRGASPSTILQEQEQRVHLTHQITRQTLICLMYCMV